MRKQRGYLMLNIGGLAIGLTSFLFIVLYVVHELSFDRFHKNYENIYRVKVVGQMAGSELEQAVTCAPLAGTLLKVFQMPLKHKTDIPSLKVYRHYEFIDL